MGATPKEWARSKRRKIDQMGDDWIEWTTKARDVCLPGVPLAALMGFCFNGDAYNTTGWRVGDDKEREDAIRKGRFPFKSEDPRDPKVYGHIGSNDLHELGWYGTEAGHCPTPVATDPKCPWVRLADDAEVMKVLDRKAVIGGDWCNAIADQCAIGVANLRRHWHSAREDLHPSLRWDEDDKRATPWRYFLAMAHWSAGGRACDHVNACAEKVAAVPEAKRWATFARLAAEADDAGNRHRQDEYTAWKTACKIEGGVVASRALPEDWAEGWLRDDGFDSEAERDAVNARLAEIAR